MEDRTSRTAWWLLLAAGVVWVVLALNLWGNADHQAVSYTAFRQDVAADQVASVVLSGSSITFTLRDAAARQLKTTAPSPPDPDFWRLIDSHHVEVWAHAGDSSLLWWTLGLVAIPVIAALVLMRRGSEPGAGGLPTTFSFNQSKARLYLSDRPRVTFDDVSGVDEAKAELQDVVDFLRLPARYHRVGARIPKGVLLMGPPGTGKTLLARALAGEARVPFLSLSATEFVEMYVGVGAARVRDLFEKARSRAPCVIFLDEIDAVGRRRGTGIANVNDEREQTLNQLLAEMDGFDSAAEIVIVAATNRPDVLDPALLRPGRFDRRVVVGLPDRSGRRAILDIHLRRVPLAADVDPDGLAAATPGLSGAELANLVNEAAVMAARADRLQVEAADFEFARDKILLGGRRRGKLAQEDRRVIAYHEAGHALVAFYVPGADPVRKISIVPHGFALGATHMVPENERTNLPRSYLEGRMTVALGGRAAEQLVFGEITSGAEADLREATRIARMMVTRWGMARHLAPAALSPDPAAEGAELLERPFSEDLAARIDQEVLEMAEDALHRAQDILGAHRAHLERLAEILLQEESIDRARFEEIARAS